MPANSATSETQIRIGNNAVLVVAYIAGNKPDRREDY